MASHFVYDAVDPEILFSMLMPSLSYSVKKRKRYGFSGKNALIPWMFG
jgi:hypothetical protein